MTDKRLRELEQQWKQTGTTEDEVLFLRERVRTSDLSVAMLKLAATCGHKPSLIAGEQYFSKENLPGKPQELEEISIEALAIMSFSVSCRVFDSILAMRQTEVPRETTEDIRSLLSLFAELMNNPADKHLQTAIEKNCFLLHSQFVRRSNYISRGFILLDGISVLRVSVYGLPWVGWRREGEFSDKVIALRGFEKVVSYAIDYFSVLETESSALQLVTNCYLQPLIDYAIYGWSDFKELIPSR